MGWVSTQNSVIPTISFAASDSEPRLSRIGLGSDWAEKMRIRIQKPSRKTTLLSGAVELFHSQTLRR